jgi:hypothetical protein
LRWLLHALPFGVTAQSDISDGAEEVHLVFLDDLEKGALVGLVDADLARPALLLQGVGHVAHDDGDGQGAGDAHGLRRTETTGDHVEEGTARAGTVSCSISPCPRSMNR